ncbi:PGAM-domain-containing protein [Exidia glandulosa HHB12029]|uniref:PGAM-domain-containing protein n=1 Tax=Exidia glandulosa HHB12029 TaxID=1314781 RepID=A0A165PBP0_EXIGL|nr:PGAM-domain-containing protein [Exidia glandulosa HHB12029]
MTRLERIYIARHGFRMNWHNPNWTTPTNVARDSPLSALGIEQAEELAKHFESMPPEERPTAIFSSPYYRCLQTATPVAQRLGIPLYVEPGIAEWYTPVVPHSGLHPRPPPAKALKGFVPTVDVSWAPTWQPSRRGETVAELYGRVADFLSVFIPRLESSLSHERILFVGHAASVIALIHDLLGEKAPVRIGCATLTTLDRKSDDILGGWKAVGKMAHADFLTGGVQRDWGIEDIKTDGDEVVEEPGVPGTENDEDVGYGLLWHSKM